jgi:hypothetical protein
VRETTGAVADTDDVGDGGDGAARVELDEQIVGAVGALTLRGVNRFFVQ